jgi:hypothetical protein
VFSDINRGCVVPNGQYTFICNGNQGNGCSNWPVQREDPPGYSLEYVPGDASFVDQWTGNAATNPTAPCAGSNPTNYSSGVNGWTAQSIVVGSSPGYAPTFNYPSTGISSFLCQSVSKLGAQINNSESEAGLYYAQFTQQSQTGNYLLVNAVVCTYSEDVEEGTTAYGGVSYNGQTCTTQGGQQVCNNAYQALEVDMASPSVQQAQSWKTACYAFRRN